MPSQPSSPEVAIVGAGPAGLIAAEVLGRAGVSVTVYDRMPSVGRKLLMAGRGGLNLTHSEEFDHFLARYAEAEPQLRPPIEAFRPEDLRVWCEGLGQETFVGSSGRVFPKAFKASPLLRAWLSRLEGLGVRFALRHRWQGFDDDGTLAFDDAAGQVSGMWVTDREAVENPGAELHIMVRNAVDTEASIVAHGGSLIWRSSPDESETYGTFRDPSGNLFGYYQQAGLEE